MAKLKQTFSFSPRFNLNLRILFFYGLCLTVLFFSLTIKNSKNAPVVFQIEDYRPSFMQQADVFLRRGEEPYLHLIAEEMILKPQEKKTFFKKPHGEAYTQSKKVIHFFGDEGIYQEKEGEIYLKDNVKAVQDTSILNSKEAKYLPEKDQFSAWGEVTTSMITAAPHKDKIFISSDYLSFSPAHNQGRYQGNVKGEIRRNRAFEPAIFFWAQTVNVFLNELKVHLEQDVHLQKEQMNAYSRKAELYLENYNKKLKYYVLYDDVKVEEKFKDQKGQILERKAYAEKLEGFVLDQKIVLTGTPKVFQGSDTLKGNRIILRQDVEVMEVDDSNSTFTVKE
ncbi:MAG: LPS export ABC transporter periplasmic protein LptC [Bacteriovoracaceae bacterium]|nr:LPS export ABC transporter periplasmic protein LptC [Bacteriovoracaceae bacterium]